MAAGGWRDATSLQRADQHGDPDTTVGFEIDGGTFAELAALAHGADPLAASS